MTIVPMDKQKLKEEFRSIGSDFEGAYGNFEVK